MINLNKYRVFSVAAVTSFAAFLFTTDAHSTTQAFTCPKLLKVMIMTGSGTTSDPARFIAQCSTASGNGISYFAGCGSNANGGRGEVLEKNQSALVANDAGPQSQPPTAVTDFSAPLTGPSRKDWSEAMAKTPLSKKGCFQSSYPGSSWAEVPCLNKGGPHVTGRLPKSVGRKPQASGAGYLPGGGDYSAQMPGPLLQVARGSFISVTGVLNEYDTRSGYPANSYSLQLNTNRFVPPNCKGALCNAEQQFVYANPNIWGDGTAGAIVLEYWLINYASTAVLPDLPCSDAGAGWFQDGSVNADGTYTCRQGVVGSPAVPLNPIENLASLSVTGSVSQTLDTAIISVGVNDLYAQANDSILNLSQYWSFAEFNIFGDGGSSEAMLNAIDQHTGVTVGVQLSLSTPGICINESTTGESNNLTLVPNSCCATGGPSPTIQFLESSASVPVTLPFCLTSDITAINSPLL